MRSRKQTHITAHTLASTHTCTAARLKGSSVCKKGIEEEARLQREAVGAQVSYATVWETFLPFSLFLSRSPSQPRMTLSAAVIRSVSREGPDSEEMGRRGVPGERRVCAMCEVCSWIRYTSFNPLRYMHTRSHLLLAHLFFMYADEMASWIPLKGQYLTFKAESRRIHQRLKSSKFSHGGFH